MRVPSLGLLAMALLGCFNPASPSASGTDGAQDSSSGTGGGCSPGSTGCPCYGNATCDAGLECNATVELCIPEDCTPGSEGCTCNDGVCLSGLECNGGVCTVPGSTTTPGTTDPGTTDPGTTDPVTTDPATTDPVTTDPVTTDPVTTDPATTDPSTTTDATDTDPTSPCAGDCQTCLQCAVGGGTVCDDPAVACGGDQACVDLFNCCGSGDVEICGLCCLEYPGAVPAYNELATCINDNLLCPACGLTYC